MSSVGQQFILTIELGNDAMNSPRDVASALKKVSKILCVVVKRGNRGGKEGSGRIRDVNGNTVGEWEYTNDDEK